MIVVPSGADKGKGDKEKGDKDKRFLFCHCEGQSFTPS
jgi:hypothetical protein